MIKPKNRDYRKSSLVGMIGYIADPLEKKIEKMLEDKQPIPQEEHLIYTEKKGGVIADYDIRTDRFEVAREAMEKFYQVGNVMNTSFDKLEKDPKDEADEPETEPEESAPAEA